MAKKESWLGGLSGNKTNNHGAAIVVKVALRMQAIEALGQPAHVFDAFAGDGQMWRDVYRDRAASYIGCDLQYYPSERLAYVGDNRRVMRCLDLSRFNFFDLDAYGSAWDQVYILTRRRAVAPGERIALVITDATKFAMTSTSYPAAIKALAGFRTAMPTAMRDEAIRSALVGAAEAFRASIVWSARGKGKSGAEAWYLAAVMQGRPAG